MRIESISYDGNRAGARVELRGDFDERDWDQLHVLIGQEVTFVRSRRKWWQRAKP